MEKEFVPYEQALALKELGFNEECLSTYTWDGFKYDVLTHISENQAVIKSRLNINNDKYTCSAPLYQQAFRWFREKYNFIGTILGDGFNGELKGYYYSVTEQGWINYYESIDDEKWYDTYEKAELECLKKLIEIVKNK
jgi:hypothetical protein